MTRYGLYTTDGPIEELVDIYPCERSAQRAGEQTIADGIEWEIEPYVEGSR